MIMIISRCFSWIASCSDIPGGTGPGEGSGSPSNALITSLQANVTIWPVSQELCLWTRIGSGQLSRRIIFVIVIMKVVEIHFTLFVNVTGQ